VYQTSWQSKFLKINTEHTGRGKIATSNQARGLESCTYLCNDAKGMLTQNIWQHADLVCNGLATGIMKEIIFDDNKPAPGLCSCIIVDFGDSYTSDPFLRLGKKGWVFSPK